MSEHTEGDVSDAEINWRLILGAGSISLLFSLALSMAVSAIAYMMFASLAERDEGQVFNMTYLEVAPRLAAVVYAVFFLVSMLALTRLRIHERKSSRPRRHWLLCFALFSLVGLTPGLLFWLMLSAADRPGI